MNTDHKPTNPPQLVDEISELSSEVWRPNNLAEYISFRKLEAVLPVWVEQEKTDRIERRRTSAMIFGLLYFEVVGATGLLIAIGLKYLDLSEGLLKIFFPSLFVQIVGLAILIVRYLFAKRENLRDLLNDGEIPGNVTKPSKLFG